MTQATPTRQCIQCGLDISHRRAQVRTCSRRCYERDRVAAAGECEKQRRHAYYVANREERRAKGHRWYLDNRETKLEANRQYRLRTNDPRRPIRIAYRDAHRSDKADYDRQYREANRDRIAAEKSAWKKRQRDVIIAKRREHYRENPEMYRRWRSARRASKAGNPSSVSLSQRDWLRTLARHDGRCAYCGARSNDIQMEHVIPLSRGGRHGIGNVLPACRSCNCSKGNRLLVEWRAARRRIEEIHGQQPNAWQATA